jgi:hypothetical protein
VRLTLTRTDPGFVMLLQTCCWLHHQAAAQIVALRKCQSLRELSNVAAAAAAIACCDVAAVLLLLSCQAARRKIRTAMRTLIAAPTCIVSTDHVQVSTVCVNSLPVHGIDALYMYSANSNHEGGLLRRRSCYHFVNDCCSFHSVPVQPECAS